MRERVIIFWHHRLTAWAVALAICVFATASVRAPPPVDAAMVERAVAGAEWLAARASETPDPTGRSGDARSLSGWLLIAGGGDTGDGYAAFDAYLVNLGYEEPDFAVQDWLEEFPRVLVAAEAARRGAGLRPLREIEAEILSLPTVPLDEAGATERNALIAERILAATPQPARAAAAAAISRIQALNELAGLRGDQ